MRLERKRTFSSLDKEEALSLIMEIRKSRRTPARVLKTSPKKSSPKRPKKVSVENLSPEAANAILDKLKELKMNGGKIK